MDIQSLSSLFAAQKNNYASTTLQPELAAKLEKSSGSLIHALVTEVSQLSSKDQQALLLLLKTQLSNLGNQKPGKQADTTSLAGTQPNEKSTQGLIARIEQLGKAIQEKNLLYLVSLRVGSDQLKTLSEKSFGAGERLAFQIRPDGQLNLLAAKNAATPAQALLKETTSNINKITESLRQYLPQSSAKNRSIQALGNLLQVISKLDSNTRNSLLPESTQLLLSKLIARVVNPEKLHISTRTGNPNIVPAAQTIKQTVEKSGSILENKLRTILRQPTTNVVPDTSTNKQNTVPQPANSATIKPVLPSVATMAPAAQIKTSSLTTQTLASSQAKEDLNEDSKAILLKLLEQLNTTQTNTNLVQRIQRNLQDPLLAILKSLGLSAKKETTDKLLQKQVTTELKQLLSSTLARIQILQLRSLSQGLNEVSNTMLPAVELSIKVNDNIYPLILYFQEKLLKEKNRDDDKEKEAKRKRKTTRQWKVFMQFEMDDCGWFASEVALLDEKVSTRFWAQQESTKSLMKNRLKALKQKMEESGLSVDNIQILPGQPPVPNTSIQQNLVDIQT